MRWASALIHRPRRAPSGAPGLPICSEKQVPCEKILPFATDRVRAHDRSRAAR